ncbi:hypothetical protein, partial [Klebsiella pneumoniae]|uniref:hypothetical protein n=1 Tax=Klebsiella pneumoniae TaxID=573 RepID=UPI003714682D
YAFLEGRQSTKANDEVGKIGVQQANSCIAYLLIRQPISACIEAFEHMVFELRIRFLPYNLHSNEGSFYPNL